MSRKQELADQIFKLREELDQIQSSERAAEAKELVGRCYRYRNCYSCPESDSDYWWLYAKVNRVDEHGWIEVMRFQIDSKGMVSVEPKMIKYELSSAYEEITPQAFDAAWENMIAYNLEIRKETV